MTDSQPQAPKQVNPSDLERLLGEQKRDVQMAINCVKIGVITAYFPGDATNGPTANVQIAQKLVIDVADDGTRTLGDYPPLEKCPVYFPQGGNYIFTFPVTIGDECIVMFNDRELDNWLFSGPGNPPTTARVHDYSDPIILVGLRSNPRGIDGLSTTEAVLRSVDYSGPDGIGESIEIGPGKIQLVADEIVIHARVKLASDAGGNGTSITPTTRTDYVIGSINNSVPLDPPGIPT